MHPLHVSFEQELIEKIPVEEQPNFAHDNVLLTTLGLSLF